MPLLPLECLHPHRRQPCQLFRLLSRHSRQLSARLARNHDQCDPRDLCVLSRQLQQLRVRSDVPGCVFPNSCRKLHRLCSKICQQLLQRQLPALLSKLHYLLVYYERLLHDYVLRVRPRFYYQPQHNDKLVSGSGRDPETRGGILFCGTRRLQLGCGDRHQCVGYLGDGSGMYLISDLVGLSLWSRAKKSSYFDYSPCAVRDMMAREEKSVR